VTGETAWPQGYASRHFATLDSTNEEARRLAAAGEPGPVWITADQQISGRGRRGRHWESPPGNLAATLLLRPNRTAADAAQLSFVAALAAADTTQSLAPQIRIAVKWPNDVLAEGCKIAGILLESAGSGSGRLDWLAVGIGINLAHHPEGTEFPATSLAALGLDPPQPAGVLSRLAADWDRWHATWCRTGFATIRDAWLARAAGLGTRIRARLQSGETSGIFEGLDDSGALLLRESQARLRAIAAGDVYF
jgi:BirA family biotin operon repressor/biotin-[acetyl-CoA-carboxylase] ligase